jgi:hypothetical protein
MASKSDYESRVARLKAAAQAKSEQKVAAASRAITKLDASGSSVTFASVAKEARVSTDFLYRTEVLKIRIVSIRSRGRALRATPSAESPSNASRDVQLGVLRMAVNELRQERDRLRDENERLRGEVITLRKNSQRATG